MHSAGLEPAASTVGTWRPIRWASSADAPGRTRTCNLCVRSASPIQLGLRCMLACVGCRCAVCTLVAYTRCPETTKPLGPVRCQGLQTVDVGYTLRDWASGPRAWPTERTVRTRERGRSTTRVDAGRTLGAGTRSVLGGCEGHRGTRVAAAAKSRCLHVGRVCRIWDCVKEKVEISCGGAWRLRPVPLRTAGARNSDARRGGGLRPGVRGALRVVSARRRRCPRSCRPSGWRRRPGRRRCRDWPAARRRCPA